MWYTDKKQYYNPYKTYNQNKDYILVNKFYKLKKSKEIKLIIWANQLLKEKSKIFVFSDKEYKRFLIKNIKVICLGQVYRPKKITKTSILY